MIEEIQNVSDRYENELKTLTDKLKSECERTRSSELTVKSN